MSLMSKLKKNSKITDSEVLSKSAFFDRELVPIKSVPIMNVALSGSFDGGLQSGLTVLAGPSKHFKTSFGLVMLKAYMDYYEDAVVLFYDTEFGSPQGYFETFGIDAERILHTPIKNIEELKFDIVGQLENLEPEDNVIIMIDSIGNAASKKELEDALDEKSVADMTRAKALKGLFRMVTPYLAMKNVPLLAVNHTYKEQGLFPKDIVGGGTGIYYSADNIWIIGRRQIKEGTEVTGYEFVIKVEKSRFVREKANIPVTVSWNGGVNKYSGIFDLALAGKFIESPSKGFYQIGDSKKMRKSEIESGDYLEQILTDEKFRKYVHDIYRIESNPAVEVIPDDEIEL